MNFRNYLQKSLSAQSALDNKFGSLTSKASEIEKLKNISLFSSASLDDLKSLDLIKILKDVNAAGKVGEKANAETVDEKANTDAEILADIADAVGVDENLTSDQKALADIVKSLMSIEEVQTVADLDNDGKLTSKETLDFLESIMSLDGDNSNFTYKDIDNALKKLDIDLEQTLDKALEEVLKDTEAKQPEATPAAASSAPSGAGSGGGGSVGRSSGSSSSRASSSDTPSETPEDIRNQIREKETEISEVESQAEKDIQAQEDAKKQAMQEIGISEKEYEQYQKKEQDVEKKIQETEDKITEQDEKITDYNSSIESNKNYIASIDAQIQANQAVISGLSSDSESGQSRINEINTKIAALEAEKSRIEAENEELEKKVKDAEDEKVKLQTEKEGYEKTKADLLNTTIDHAGASRGKTPAEINKIKTDLAQYDTEISRIRTEKETRISALRGDIQALKTKLSDMEANETRNAFLRENSAKEGQSIVDFATQFDGMSSEEMYSIMRDGGYRVDEGQWCADFVYFALAETLGEDNLPDWYKNCNYAGCTSVYYAAVDADAIIDVSQVQPGDVVLFSKNNGESYYHTGIVVEVGEDGTLYTMEGNTWTNNYNWGAHRRTYDMNSGDRTYTFISMS